MTPSYRTFVDVLLPLQTCERQGARFVQRSGAATLYSYKDIVARAQVAAGTLQARGLRPGDRVGILLPTCVEFFDVFSARCSRAGYPRRCTGHLLRLATEVGKSQLAWSGDGVGVRCFRATTRRWTSSSH
jgi:hypothetical protein